MLEWISRLSFRTKISIQYFLLGLVTLSILSIFFYFQFKLAMLNRTTDQLLSVNRITQKAFEQFIRNLPSQIVFEENREKVHKQFFENTFDTIYTLPKQEVSYPKSEGYDVIKYNALQKSKLVYYKQVSDSIRFYVIKTSELNEIVLEHHGLGETGETYLVDSDNEMITTSRFIKTINTVNTFATRQLAKGIYGSAILQDYRGIDVVSVFYPIAPKSLKLYIISEMDLNEAMSPVLNLRNKMIFYSILVSFIFLFLSIGFTHQISRPIVTMSKYILQLAKGDISIQVKRRKANDEIKRLYEAIEVLIENLHKKIDFATEIGEGKLNTNFSPISSRDLLGKALLKMRDDLLESKIKEEHFNRMRTLGMVEGQEKERERLSRDLHDGIGQMITALRLQIDLLPIDDQTMVVRLKQLIDDIIKEVRQISKDAMPSVLIDFGLEAGLKYLVDYTNQLSIGVKLNFIYINDGISNKTPYEVRVNLYRIAQEAINNAIKYSGSDTIDLTVIRDDNHIRMTVTDYGKGFDLTQKQTGKGLLNMEERVRILAGTFHIETNTSGTNLEIEIPYNNE